MKYLLLVWLFNACTCRPVAVSKKNHPTEEPRTFVLNGDSDSRTAGKLETIFFEENRVALSLQQIKSLKANASILIDNPEWTIGITGITANRDLKEERAFEYALYVKELLIQYNVSGKRIKVFTSYVETEPTDSDKHFERVVFNLIQLRSK